MSEYYLAGLIMLVATIIAVLCTVISFYIDRRKKINRRTREYKQALKIERRKTATKYAEDLQRAYLMTLYGGK